MKLTKHAIDGIFNRAQHQQEYAYALYRIAVPFFDKRAISIEGYPAVSRVTGQYLMKQAIAFDREHHPDVMNGGLWLSVGFSSKENIPDWTVDLTEAEVTYATPLLHLSRRT